MKKVYIYRPLIDDLEKKLNRIFRKLEKAGIPYTYERENLEYIEIEKDLVLPFYPIKVEGELHHDNWHFVGKLTATSHGNIVNSCNSEIEIPESYRNAKIVCDHCGTNRRRKYSYIIYNSVTNEFKQVGKNCLEEYTNGLSAENAAYIMSMFDIISDTACYHIDPTDFNTIPEIAYNIDKILVITKKVVEKEGYMSTDRAYRDNIMSTKQAVIALYNFYIRHIKAYDDNIVQLIDRVSITDTDLQNMENEGKQIRNWIANLTPNSDYIHNVQIICKKDFWAGEKYVGYLCGIIPNYLKYLKNQKNSDNVATCSEFQGRIGDKLSIDVVSASILWKSMGDYGMYYLYKFSDNFGNEYIWSTSKQLDVTNITKISGTVKSHKTFRNVKQTYLTRCKTA